MYQRQREHKPEEKKPAVRRDAAEPTAARPESSPHAGVPAAGARMLTLQARFGNRHVQRVVDAARANRTGLPDELKTGVEALSGRSLDDVRVHYNSPKPAEVQALAYTEGTEIHVAPGQEQHLPHEAWHVVQQMQGRVRPTMQLSEDVPVNDDERLEREADRMGATASALPMQRFRSATQPVATGAGRSSDVVQMEKYVDNKTSPIHLHLDIGTEDHLIIQGERYNLMNRSGYDPERVAAARRALRKAPYLKDKVACEKVLARLA